MAMDQKIDMNIAANKAGDKVPADNAKSSTRRRRAKTASGLTAAPRETKVQLNLRVDAEVKTRFQMYCARIGKSHRQGEVWMKSWMDFEKNNPTE